jgi:hypothetical protein
MSAPVRVWGTTCGALLLVVLVAGCRQFKVTGAPDPCPTQSRLGANEVQKCWEKHETTLTTERPFTDSAGGGQLYGEALPIAGRRLRHAVALDYSGSMYGGYDDEHPGVPPCGWHFESESSDRHIRNGPYYWEQEGFARLFADGPLGALTGNEPVYPIVFNRDVTVLGADGFYSTFDEAAGRFDAPLPAPLQGRDAVLGLLTAVGSGRLPANPAHAPYGDPHETHLNEVLDAGAALFESFRERDGILWIVTDNIIELANSGDGEVLRDVRYNQKFYDTLKHDSRWQVVQAWPIHQAPWLCGSTLMTYGLYYSSRPRIDERGYRELCRGAEAQLAHEHQIEAFRRYAHSESPAPGQPFKLKPDDIDVVELSFVGQVMCDVVKVDMPGECRAQIKIENLLNHRQVDAADIVLVNSRCDPWGQHLRWLRPVRIAVPFCAGSITRSFPLPHPILPGHPETLAIRFPSPPVRTVRATFADQWESANYDRFLMLGRMDVGIRNLRTSMVIQTGALKDVYGVESLPDVFLNPSTDNLRTSICLPLSVQNPSFFASFVLFILIATAALVVGISIWLVTPRFRTILIDDVDQGRFRLSRVGSHDLKLKEQRIGKANLGWDGAPAIRGVGGYKIRKEGNHWVYKNEAEGIEGRIDVVSGESRRAVLRKNDDF